MNAMAMTWTAAGLRARYGVLLPHLDERARRLVLGADAAAFGHGGIAWVARSAGVDPKTVTAGLEELDAGGDPLSAGRVRVPGAGRPRAETRNPGLVAALLGLVEPTRRGDPMSPLSWTCLSTRRLAAALSTAGHAVSRTTVAGLLKANGFSLQGNAKTVEGASHPDRDGQFGYLDARLKEYLAAGDPVISVDTKKKELVGNFKNNGREWAPAGSPTPVSVHDFKGPLGRANPYGVYDVGANRGWVSVGTSHDTPAFAVHTIRTWWDSTGQYTYPHTRRLLITADGGGSNGYRTRAWKTELAAFAAETGLHVTVCHLPPGTSKWNKIEHRLFAHITMNWRGRPLTSHDVIVSAIAATSTSTGLRVQAILDTDDYPTGVKISDQQMRALATDGTWTPHEWHGEWNYTIQPTPDPAPETVLEAALKADLEAGLEAGRAA